jgi:hypothetical protein
MTNQIRARKDAEKGTTMKRAFIILMAIGLMLAASGCHKKYTEDVQGASWIGVF